MATLRLTSSPAEPGPAGMISYAPMRDVIPPEAATVRNLREATAALDEYAARVAATGQPARVAARIVDGRAPAGFNGSRPVRFVNLPQEN